MGASVRSGDYLGLTIGLITGFFTLFSMIKIWSEVFLKKAPHDIKPRALPRLQLLPIGLFALWTIWIGFFPGVFAELSQKAAEQTLNPKRYELIIDSMENTR
ncbi:MAG: hypothetical protein HC902_02755 [Calothrix sp. SM1_5_4]|nr:hypothetical protein [Calothrix sp. SM1_5_4]